MGMIAREADYGAHSQGFQHIDVGHDPGGDCIKHRCWSDYIHSKGSVVLGFTWYRISGYFSRPFSGRINWLAFQPNLGNCTNTLSPKSELYPLYGSCGCNRRTRWIV